MGSQRGVMLSSKQNSLFFFGRLKEQVADLQMALQHQKRNSLSTAESMSSAQACFNVDKLTLDTRPSPQCGAMSVCSHEGSCEAYKYWHI